MIKFTLMVSCMIQLPEADICLGLVSLQNIELISFAQSELRLEGLEYGNVFVDGTLDGVEDCTIGRGVTMHMGSNVSTVIVNYSELCRIL